MRRPRWMIKRDISWADLLKMSAAMGFLMFFVIVMITGAIGAALQ